MIVIPDKFFKTPYNAKRYPGRKLAFDVSKGANCQLFVYELLRLNGFDIPFTFRSSDLWEDTQHTEKVDTLKPFDIVFFNNSSNPYGAHLGLCISSGKVAHLSSIVGFPVIWSMDDFKKYDQYNCFLGAKRLKKKIKL